MKRFGAILLVFCLLLVTFTGCGKGRNVISDLFGKKEEKAPSYEKVKTQLNTTPLEKDELYQGFFILHDGKYYPASGSTWCSNDDFAKELYGDKPVLDTSHVVAFNDAYDLQIPTLFLENDDKLIYYSDAAILDFVYFMRYKDCGYSVPLANIQTTKGGYLYIPIDKEAIDSKDVKSPVLDSTISEELLNIYGKDTPADSVYQIRLDTVNEQALSADWLTDFGTIKGCEKNKEYAFNAVVGSLNYNFTAKAEYHYMQEYELYAEAEYETLFDNTYIVPIPKHLKTGYYMLTNGCFFRLVTSGDSYNLYDSDFFNEEQLYMIAEGEDKAASYGVYSTNELLNTYSSDVEGTLGYVEEEIYVKDDALLAENEEIGTLSDVTKKYCALIAKEDFSMEGESILYEFTSKPGANLEEVTPVKQYKNGYGENAITKITDTGFVFYGENTEKISYKAGDTIYLECTYVGSPDYVMTYVDEHFNVKTITALPEDATTAGNRR